MVATPRGWALAALLALSCTPARAPDYGAGASPGAETPRFPAYAAYQTEPTAGGTRGGPSAARLRDMIREKLPSLELAEDGRLAELAARVLYRARDAGRGPSATELDALAREVGFVVALPMVGVFPMHGDTFSGLDDYLASIPKNMRFSHLGVTVVDLGGVLAGAAALAGEHVSLEPVPRRVVAAASITLRGKVAPEYRSVEVAWTHPDGKTERHALPAGLALDERSPPLGLGLHRVEILAVGPSGLEVIANFPIAAGVDFPAVTAEAGVIDESDPRAALFELTNAARRNAGAPVLAPDPVLDRVAEGHSREMAEAGFFGHQSPTTGMVDDRARAAGLRLGLIGENVAKAPSIADAHALLMGSPGHRDNILNPRFSHVGIGVVLERATEPKVFSVTEVFAQVPAPLADVAEAANTAFSAVQKARHDADARELVRSRELDAVARQIAERVAAEPGRDLGEIANGVAKPFVQRTRVGLPLILITFFADPNDVGTDARVRDPKLRAAGVAVVQAPANDATRANVIVVVASG